MKRKKKYHRLSYDNKRDINVFIRFFFIRFWVEFEITIEFILFLILLLFREIPELV